MEHTEAMQSKRPRLLKLEKQTSRDGDVDGEEAGRRALVRENDPASCVCQ